MRSDIQCGSTESGQHPHDQDANRVSVVLKLEREFVFSDLHAGGLNL